MGKINSPCVECLPAPLACLLRTSNTRAGDQPMEASVNSRTLRRLRADSQVDECASISTLLEAINFREHVSEELRIH